MRPTSTLLFDSVIAMLSSTGEIFELIEHQPVFTSETASKLCDHPPEQGTKSLALFKKDRYVVATIAGDERFDFPLIAKLVGEKKLSMATEKSLVESLGTEVGGLAPFGYGPCVTLVVSERLFDGPVVYFNPGRNDRTIRMASSAFRRMMNAAGAIFLNTIDG